MSPNYPEAFEVLSSVSLLSNPIQDEYRKEREKKALGLKAIGKLEMHEVGALPIVPRRGTSTYL